MIRKIIVVLLVLSAGCSGVSDSQQTDTSPHSSSIQTSELITPQIGPADSTDENTIRYENLSAKQQEAFDKAVESEVQFLYQTTIESPYIEGDYFPRWTANIFEEAKYVIMEKDFYRITYDPEGGAIFSSYGIRATENRPHENESVVNFNNLSAESKEPVREAAENGSYEVPAGKWDSVPGSLSSIEYVSVSGTTYEITIIYGDEWAGTLHAERVEPRGES